MAFRTWLRGLLLRNVSLKLVSLGLALLLFVVVRAEKESLAQGTIPVTFSTPPGKVLVGQLPAQVRVGVLGPASRMQRFRFEDLTGIHVDLATVSDGYLKFEQDMVRLPPGLKIDSIRPAGVVVKLELLSVRRVTVVPTIQGQLAGGYQVTKRWVVPEQVTVTGPSSVVKSLSRVATKPVSVEGASTSLVQRVGLQPLPQQVKLSGGQQFEVHVRVGPASSEVVVRGVRVFFEDSAGRLGQPSPEVVNVLVSGPTQVLANLPRDRLAARPQAGAVTAGSTQLELTVTGIPKGVKLISVEPPKVTFAYKQKDKPTEP